MRKCYKQWGLLNIREKNYKMHGRTVVEICPFFFNTNIKYREEKLQDAWDNF